MIIELVPPELAPFPAVFPDFVKHFARRHHEMFGDRVTRVVGRGDGEYVVVMVEIDGKTGRHRFGADILDAGVDAWDEITAVMVATVQRDLDNIADGEPA